MRIPLFWQILPVHCLILSLFLLPAWQHHAAVANALSAERAAQHNLAVKKDAANYKVSGKPTRILLPRLGIDLRVDDGRYNFTSSAWSVTNATANYAVNTVEPNNRHDKTLIYGHWTPKVFGPTKDLRAGDKVYVYTANGHTLEYRYEYNTVVKPTDTHVFNDFKGRPGLVLMTCQGLWAQERRLMFFNLKAAT
jgi:LPXTG-site transpeptidase (sortase) family protein